MSKIEIRTTKKSDIQLVRRLNSALVLDLIRIEKTISRVDIAKRLGVHKSTVSAIIQNLLDEGIIQEETIGNSARGVKPILYSLNHNDNLFGAIYIDKPHSNIAIVDIEAKILIKETIRTQSDNSEQFLKSCIKFLKKLQNELGIDKICGIGVSVPGILDPDQNVLIEASNLNWENIHLKEIFSSEVKEPVLFSNEIHAAALAEWWFSPIDIVRDSNAVLNIGYGVGFAFRMDGHLYKGSFNRASEFGHTVIDLNGPLCSCGNHGCLEAFTSDKATVERYYEIKNKTFQGEVDLEMDWIIRKAQSSEREAVKVLKEKSRYLGIGISNIINIFDPLSIVILGKITKCWDLVLPEIEKNLRTGIRHLGERKVKIIPGSLGENIMIIGAATLIIRDMIRKVIG